MEPSPRRNIEIKARLRDLDRARQVARELVPERPQILQQTDTYYRCTQGRLKLRQFSAGTAELIAYARPDDDGPRLSQYHLLKIADAQTLDEALRTTLGVLVVVRKVREVYLHENVRIHLDEVEGLGAFLEFEAVLERTLTTATGEQQVRELCDLFTLAPADLIAGSYSDLLLRAVQRRD
ncbi:MAG: class IV adenylate cyclase [Singulisphaera sp.]